MSIKTESKRRFRIERLEERIAPTNCGNPCGGGGGGGSKGHGGGGSKGGGGGSKGGGGKCK